MGPKVFHAYPRRGWRHRRAVIARTLIDTAVFVACCIAFALLIWALAGAPLPGDAR